MTNLEQRRFGKLGAAKKPTKIIQPMIFGSAMPVLPLETYIFPDNILESEFEEAEDPLEEDEERWWTLHTRPRSEKALARRLFKRQISYFLPLYEFRRRIQRRLVCSNLPLFPGYLFLKGGEEVRQIALETNLVAKSLYIEDQQKFLQDLTQILRLIRTGSPLSPTERLQPGMPAKIVSGPLAGLRGKVLQKRGAKVLKFVIEVEFLQQGTSVEVDSSMVQPL